MTETDSSVEAFVDNYIEAGDDRIQIDRLWREYSGRNPYGVSRRKFRWHLQTSLPLVATWTTENEAVGVQFKNGSVGACSA